MDPNQPSSSRLHQQPSRSPSKRSKSKSKMWNKVVRLTRKTRDSHLSAAFGLDDHAAVGEIGGSADIPVEPMDADDIPSTSSTHSSNTSRYVSDWSSSNESIYGQIRDMDKCQHKVMYNSGAVVFQPCIKPSLVKSVLGNCSGNVKSKVKARDKKSKGRSVKRKSGHLDSKGVIWDTSCEETESQQGFDRSTSYQEQCHCPACCNCRASFRSPIYKSWPRKYECPLKALVKGSQSEYEVIQSRIHLSSSIIQHLSDSLNARNTSENYRYDQTGGETSDCRRGHAYLPKFVGGCCCARKVECDRKSRSLPNRATLNSDFDLSSSPEETYLLKHDFSSGQGTVQSTYLKEVENGEILPRNLGVDGGVFKKRMDIVLEWFNEFNDQQKNSMIKRLLEQCDLPQMHMLSITMEPILHQHCPHNCQDLLSWLPKSLSSKILSYLDPESLCMCSQVSRTWQIMANESSLWKKFCLQPSWSLSKAEEQKQLINHMSSFVHWKQVFAERYRLCRNWLRGRCTVRTFEGHTQGISCVQFDDTRIVSGSSDQTIKVWNIRTNSPWSVQTLTGHSGTVRCLHLEKNRLVSGSTDRSIKVWDLSTQSNWSSIACRVTMVGHMDTVRCLQVDDDKVVSGSYDMTLKVWDIKTGRCRHTLRGHHGAVLCLQFDDVKIISGSADNTIKIWSLREEQCLTTLTGHQDAVTCLQFDASKIISGSLDRNLKYWDLITGHCTSTIDWAHAEGHTGVIRCLQADSWRVVSASDDRTIKVWNFDTGERLVTLRHHTDGVTCLQFNSSKIVSGSYDKTVKLWDFGSV